MAIRHPRRLPREGDTVDYEDYAQALEPLVDELEGRLNENNFNEALRDELNTHRGRLAPNWAGGSKSVSFGNGRSLTYSQWHHCSTTLSTGGRPANYDLSLVREFRLSPDWQTVLSLQVTSLEGGVFRIIGGGQYHVGSVRFDAVSTTFHIRRAWTTYWGIRVNRSVHGQNVNGDQDESNSPEYMERGYGETCGAAKIDTLVNLPPGPSQIDLVLRMAPRSQKGLKIPSQGPTGVAAADRNNRLVEVVTAAELIAIELAR